LVGFEKAITEEEIAYVKENVTKLNGKEVSWSVPDGEHSNAYNFQFRSLLPCDAENVEDS
jgi:lupus La protein